jgi:indole-3-glycerol phosphate synthase
VSQSGISQPDQVRELSRAGVDAIQVGTVLMEDNDPATALALLMTGIE